LATTAQERTRELTVFAQDPSVRDARGRIIRATVTVPAEDLDRGPRGYRVHCIDFDATTNTYYRTGISNEKDLFKDKTDRELLEDPNFHCQNVYALVMHTLARFEYALGRRVSWGFYGHQLKVSPHAFREANAFYSEKDHSLMFGYVPNGRSTVYTCLSHDVVVHETTHALIDGLRTRYTDPSSADQAAIHEGFDSAVSARPEDERQTDRGEKTHGQGPAGSDRKSGRGDGRRLARRARRTAAALDAGPAARPQVSRQSGVRRAASPR
jgi:hypothetical protein